MKFSIITMGLAACICLSLAAPVSSANAMVSTSFDCSTLDGTNVRDGEYFFPQECSTTNDKYCTCDMTNKEPPTHANCKTKKKKDIISLLGDAEPAKHTRDYSCKCTVGPDGQRGIRCSIIILP